MAIQHGTSIFLKSVYMANKHGAGPEVYVEVCGHAGAQFNVTTRGNSTEAAELKIHKWSGENGPISNGDSVYLTNPAHAKRKDAGGKEVYVEVCGHEGAQFNVSTRGNKTDAAEFKIYKFDKKSGDGMIYGGESVYFTNPAHAKRTGKEVYVEVCGRSGAQFNVVTRGEKLPQSEFKIDKWDDTPKVFLSHTGRTSALAYMIKGMITEELPKCKTWSMENIAVGSGSGGRDKFSGQISKEIHDCTTVVGICDNSCANSHPEWGSPAEWKMGIEQGKRVIVLCLDGELEAARASNVVKELEKKLQFFFIPANSLSPGAKETKMLKAMIKGEVTKQII